MPNAKRRRNCSWRHRGDGGRAGQPGPGQTTSVDVWVPLARDDIRGEKRFYGVAETSDTCSDARVTQALRRCSPLIAPVTLRTLPAPHEVSCTKATS